MSLLKRNHKVTTRYGGGFVQSIEGLAGGSEGGRPVDWFYYVNGVEAPRGPRRRTSTPAITSGGITTTGARPRTSRPSSAPSPSRSSTASPASDCRSASNASKPPSGPALWSPPGCVKPVSQRPSRRSERAAGNAQGACRSLVPGARRTVGRSDRSRPRASGVYARVSRTGSSITVLDADGLPVRMLSAGAGLIAATRQAEEAPVWVVTGTDSAGVEGAARRSTGPRSNGGSPSPPSRARRSLFPPAPSLGGGVRISAAPADGDRLPQTASPLHAAVPLWPRPTVRRLRVAR